MHRKPISPWKVRTLSCNVWKEKASILYLLIPADNPSNFIRRWPESHLSASCFPGLCDDCQGVRHSGFDGDETQWGSESHSDDAGNGWSVPPGLSYRVLRTCVADDSPGQDLPWYYWGISFSGRYYWFFPENFLFQTWKIGILLYYYIKRDFF